MTQIPSETNFKKWAFQCLIYFVILHLIMVYLVVSYRDGFESEGQLVSTLSKLSIVGNILLILGIALTLMSILNKEKKNYQYYSATIGFSILILMTLASLFQSV